MNLIVLFIVTFCIGFIVEVKFKPRLDFTKDKLLLWYSIKSKSGEVFREFIILKEYDE